MMLGKGYPSPLGGPMVGSSGASIGSPSGSTSTGLLRGIIGGDPLAWQRFVAIYGPLIYGWCRRAGLRPEDARDVVQEVMGSVLSGIGEFRGAPHGGVFRAWLRSIARNKAIDHFRRHQHEPEGQGGTAAHQRLLQLEQSFDSSADHAADEQREVWRRTLDLVRAQFEPNTWQAFRRTAVDGRPAAQVAAELQMTRQAVYMAKSRVLSRLREELGDLEAEP